MSKHTQRTYNLLRKNFYEPFCSVERWIPIPSHPGKGVRKDAFGIIDIEAMGPEYLGIQSCGSAFSAHHNKIIDDEELKKTLKKYISYPCHRFILIGWRKVKLKRGGKAMTWKPRIREYYIEDNEIKWMNRKEI